MIIGVVGGTGSLGSAIARRLAKGGCRVLIGSRSTENAGKAASELGFGLAGDSNVAVAKAAGIVIVTVPFAAQEATLREIAPHVAGKIVVETTVPLRPPKVMRVHLPAEGSAAQRAQQILGESVTVTSAFHNVAAHKLITDADIGCDVLVFGDSREARAAVIDLVRKAGLRGLHAGSLANSAAAEAMTSILIFLNKTYKVDGAGIMITGTLIEPDSAT